MRKLYAVSRTVYRHIDKGTFVPQTEVQIKAGRSAESVERHQLTEALTMFPKREGWRGHRIKARSLNNRRVNDLLGHQPQM